MENLDLSSFSVLLSSQKLISSSHLSRDIAAAVPVPLGRVVLPGAAAEQQTVTLSATQFQRLHAVLAS